MSIRRKILIYFSAVSIGLLGIACFVIYTLFAEYREEEFQIRQKGKIELTLNFLSETKHIDERILQALGRVNVNSLHDEKLLIYDQDKTLIYSSIDDTPIHFERNVLNELSSKVRWKEWKEGDYDVVGLFLESEHGAFYGLNKAYDTFGYTKLNFLKWTLIGTFLAISLVIILVSIYLSYRLSEPLIAFSDRITQFSFEKLNNPITVDTDTSEIRILGQQFNALMHRLEVAYGFQKNAINHISHELKTPIAILVSNFERMEREKDTTRFKAMLQEQKEDTKELGEIVNTLLQLTKVESDKSLKSAIIRVDELLFDVIDDVQRIDDQFHFLVNYEITTEEASLEVNVDIGLLKIALTNLLINAMHYASDSQAHIGIATHLNEVILSIQNKGAVIEKKEREKLFTHFFRGTNSRGKRGFGLGLVFVKKVIQLHQGTIVYKSNNSDHNEFIITLRTA